MSPQDFARESFAASAEGVGSRDWRSAACDDGIRYRLRSDVGSRQQPVPSWCELVGVEIDNLRGFSHAALTLNRPLTLLVGPNNAGKTSLLRLLHWALTDLEDDLPEGRRKLNSDECALLLPSRETRGAARRLTLKVAIPDGRRARRYKAVRGVAHLRLRTSGASSPHCESADRRR